MTSETYLRNRQGCGLALDAYIMNSIMAWRTLLENTPRDQEYVCSEFSLLQIKFV